jgi:transposase
MLVWRGPKIRRAYILFRLHNAWRDSSLWQTINHVHQSASHKLVIYMATFLTRFSPFFQYFRHFLVSARRKFGLTDTIGLPVGMTVHPANVQDRDGAPDLLASVRSLYPWLRHVFADGGYAGEKLKGALEGLGNWAIEIVKRSDTAKGFILLPRRWVVERTIAWLNRNRRLAKDVEATIESSVTWLYIASVKLMSRRLAAV